MPTGTRGGAKDAVKDLTYELHKVLPKRLKKFALAVAPEKTCVHRFSRFHAGRKRRFTFLGFEFYWEADSMGTPRVWRRTAKKKLHGSIRVCTEWLKVNRHKRLLVLLKTLIRKVRGHYNYFRVVGNSRGLPSSRVPDRESGACVKTGLATRVSMFEEPCAGKSHAGIWAGGAG